MPSVVIPRWLIGGTASLGAFYLYMVWTHTHDLDRLGFNVLGLSALFYLVWEKVSSTGVAGRSVWSAILGVSLILWGVMSSLLFPSPEFFLSYYIKSLPLLLILAIAIFFSGFRGPKSKFSQPLILALFLMVSEGNLLKALLIDFGLTDQEFTATLTAWLLKVLGFSITRQGASLSLPTGLVEVYPGCASVIQIFYLMRLVTLFFFLFPTRFWQKIGILSAAVGIGIVLNTMRIALLVIVSANDVLFSYWHTGEGSSLFSLVAAGALATGCYFLAIRDSNIQSALDDGQR
jgi:cyanoexosortase A